MDSERFLNVLRRDWCEGVVEEELNELCTDSIKIYQVIDCIDISKPRHKLDELLDCEEDSKEDSLAIPGIVNKTNRMLKLTLYDGKNSYIGYEYEPIAALDLFQLCANNPRRCCSKIAIYNSPKTYRNAIWLTQYNIKLMFEGYVCIHNTHSSEYNSTFAQTNDSSDLCANANQSTIGDVSSNTLVNKSNDDLLDFSREEIDKILLGAEFMGDDAHEKPVSGCDVDRIEFDAYFPKESDYAKNSYLMHLCKNNVKSTNEEFLKYSRQYIMDAIGDNNVTIYNLCNTLNTRFKRDVDYNAVVDDIINEYKFGYLDHTVPLFTGVVHEKCDYNNMQIKNMLNSLVDKCFNNGHLNKNNFWFGVFDDCITNTSFFIFSLKTLLPFINGEHTNDLLSISLKLNMLEGFFRFETVSVDGTSITVLKEYNNKLEHQLYQQRITKINEQYNLLESLINF